MLSFITGSRAYGVVKPSSDIDLVIRTNEETAERLRALSEKHHDKDGKLKRTIRFGKLNLVVCTSDAEFAAWLIGTEDLKRRATRTNKEDAREVFEALRKMAGTPYKGDNGDA